MRIEDTLEESCVINEIRGKTKEQVLAELVMALKKANIIQNEYEVVRVIQEREKLGSTGIGEGVAIPHGKLKGLQNIICVFGRSTEGYRPQTSFYNQYVSFRTGS